jgi:hypothetical protein
VPMVFKCLSLTVGILPLKLAHESMFPNLITPNLNILIDCPRLLNNLHVYIQTFVLDGP